MDTDKWVSRSWDHLANRNYEEALVASEEALRTDPGNYKAWLVRGAILRRLKKYEEALEAFEHASHLKPQKDTVWIGKGLVLHSLERYEEALESYDEALRIDQSCFAAWLGKASAYSALKKFKEALESYDKAIEIDPNDFAARFSRGLILYNLKNYTDAISAFDTIIGLKSPGCILALGAKAVALQELGKRKDASITYKKLLDASAEAIEKDSQDSFVLISKAYALAYFRRYEEALEAFSKAAEIDPQNSHIWNDIGTALYNLKRYEEAQEAYMKAVRMNPGAQSPYVNLGELLLDLGCIKKASDYVEKALSMNEECVSALALKGRIRIEEGKYNDAAKLFSDAICLNPGNLRLLLWDIYSQYLDIEFNLQLERGACLAIPENIRREKYLEKMYLTMREKKYQEEITAIARKLERIHSLSERHAERDLREFILYFLGYFYYKSNDISRAKRRLEECIALESRRRRLWEFIDSGSWKNESFILTSSELKWEKFKRFITARSFIERDARELLNCIWRYKTEPTWWNWWLFSPIHRWLKRTVLALVLFLLLLIILHLVIPGFLFLTSIDKSFYVVFIVTLIFFLLSPSIWSVKIKDVQVELHSPPSLEPILSPLEMEEGIRRIESLSGI